MFYDFVEEKQITRYMIFPTFLLEMNLNPTTMIVYMLLLNRIRLSIKNKKKWTDSSGRVYCNFRIDDLASEIGRSSTTVKSCLNALREAKLIETVQIGINNPNKIYIKIPSHDIVSHDDGQEENFPSGQQEILLSGGEVFLPPDNKKSYCPDRQKPNHPESGKQSTNIKNNIYKNIINNELNNNTASDIDQCEEAAPLSSFLRLSDQEWAKFKKLYPGDLAFSLFLEARNIAFNARKPQGFSFLLSVAEELKKNK